jgi:hypothetical protein
MNYNKAGGPAFPIVGHSGMTLRDYFAAATLAGLCSNMELGTVETAKMAYIQADAMLEERKNELE